MSEQQITAEDKQIALELMQVMLKAAGKQQPHILGMAAAWIVELAFMTGQPDNYIHYKLKRKAVK